MNKKNTEFKGYIFNDEEMKNNDHVKLIYYDNNTITYLNSDGTKTTYVSSVPIEKKKLYIEKIDSYYESVGNNVNVMLPEILNQDTGICIGEFINVHPALNREYDSELIERRNAFGQLKQCVEYKSGYRNDSLYCYTTSFGLNFEFVIPERNDDNIYSIKIKQPKELFIEEESDYITFRNLEDLQSMIFTSLAVDANGVWDYNNKIIVSFEEEGVCYIHFIINEEFLKNNKTNYPVVINQSINAYRHKQPDTSIYSETDDSVRHYLSPYMLLGDKTIKGEGWALLRYEVLDDLNIKGEDVIKADYYFSNLYEAKNDVTVGAYAIINDWCSVNTRWNSRPKHDDMPICTTKVKSRGLHNVDITSLLKEMLEGRGEYEPLHSVRNSFLLKSDSRDSSLILASGDSGIETPYLKIISK